MSEKASPPPAASESSRRRKLPFWRRVLVRYTRLGLFAKIALWCVLAAPLVYLAALKVGKPVYKNWKQANALRMAENYAEAGDFQAASMAFRKALRTSSKNPTAWAKVAGFLEEQGSPDAIMAWDRYVRLAPDDLNGRFKLIENMLAHHRKLDARAALDKVPESARGDARYYRAMGALLADEGNFPGALVFFEKAHGVDPDLEGLGLQYAIARLRGGNLSQRVDAVEFLGELGKNENSEGVQALRELFADAVQRNDTVSAQVYAERLMAHPSMSMRDRLVLADFELSSGGMFFPLAIQELRDHGRDNPHDIPTIVNYLLARGRRAEASQWIEDISGELALDSRVQMALFDVRLAGDDWSAALDALAASAATGTLPMEMIQPSRDAMDLLESSRSDALAAWQRAVAAAENSPEGLMALVKLARARKWEEGQMRALWTLAGKRPTVPELWYELVRLESARKNLNGVYQALQGALRAAPDNLPLRSNFVIVSFLLGKGNAAELLEMGHSAYESAPQNPFFITSYAVALINAGDSATAASIIEELPAAEAAVPERALYRGVVYAEAERTDEARAALDSAREGLARMLPEEKLLHTATLAKLDGKTLSEDEIRTALRASGSSEEDKKALAESLRKGREGREDSAALADTLREARSQQGRDEAVVEELKRQREAQQRAPDEMRALVDELRTAPEEAEAKD